MNRRGFLAVIAVTAFMAPMPWLRRTIEVAHEKCRYCLSLTMKPDIISLQVGDLITIGESYSPARVVGIQRKIVLSATLSREREWKQIIVDLEMMDDYEPFEAPYREDDLLQNPFELLDHLNKSGAFAHEIMLKCDTATLYKASLIPASGPDTYNHQYLRYGVRHHTGEG